MVEILVYSPDPREAARYLALLKASLPHVGIGSASTLSEAEPLIADARILVGWKFPPGLLGFGGSLQWVHKVSAGVEDVTGAPDRPAGLRLSRSGGEAIAPRMVEYVLGAIYATTQQFPRAFRQKAQARWESYPVGRASGQTVGVAGLGDIGFTIAEALHRNGMNVVGWRRSPGLAEVPLSRLYSGREKLLDFAADCDFLVSVLPATAETDGLFDSAVFSAMKRTSVFINVGRGNCVDEDALVAAVTQGRIASAFLDVVAQEPLPPSSPLWAIDNISITPHVSGPIIPEDVVPEFLENFARFNRGLALLKEVDLERGY